MAWVKSVTRFRQLEFRQPGFRQLGLLAVLMAALPLFFVGGPDWVSPPLFRAAWSLGHIPFFALLLVWVQSYRSLTRPVHWLWVTLAVVVLSLVIELIQSQVGRDANWQDGLRNLIGAWLGLFWCQPGRPLVWGGRVIATGLLLWQLSGLGSELLNHHHRVQQFPVLSDFESARDLSRWTGNIERVSEPVAQGRYSLAIELGTGRYSGVGMEALPGDWQSYQTLHFSLYNPDNDELALTLRINDVPHDRGDGLYNDRFNHRFLVQPGWNHYRIELDKVRLAPEDRPMNMARIRRLGIFATRLPEERRVYLDSVRLE